MRGDIGRALGLEAVGGVLRVLDRHTTDVELVSHGGYVVVVDGGLVRDYRSRVTIKNYISSTQDASRRERCTKAVKTRVVKRHRDAPETLRARKKGAASFLENDRRNESEDQKSGLHRACSGDVFAHTEGFVCVWNEFGGRKRQGWRL